MEQSRTKLELNKCSVMLQLQQFVLTAVHLVEAHATPPNHQVDATSPVGCVADDVVIKTLQVRQFMDRHILPAEHILEAHASSPTTKWTIHPLMEQLKDKSMLNAVFDGAVGSAVHGQAHPTS